MREDRRRLYDDGFRRPDGMAGDAPVRQVDQQAHVRLAPADMGWQCQHQWWRDELERLGIRQSMSRKGNCLDNAATEQVFGHLKDEFYRGRESSTRTNSSNANWTPTSSIGTPDGARYDSRDIPRRSSGACPSRSRAVS